jgi:uncharacterized protein DUF4140
MDTMDTTTADTAETAQPSETAGAGSRETTPEATQTTLTTRIVGVTVYPDRAQVTHAGQTQIAQPGEHTLRIGDLPLALQRESLRATGRGPAGTRILGVEQATQMHPTAPEETLRRLRDEIERLEREVTMLDERIRTIEEEQQWLRTLGEQTARSLAWGMARGTAKPGDIGGFFSFAGRSASLRRSWTCKRRARRRSASWTRDGANMRSSGARAAPTASPRSCASRSRLRGRWRSSCRTSSRGRAGIRATTPAWTSPRRASVSRSKRW